MSFYDELKRAYYHRVVLGRAGAPFAADGGDAAAGPQLGVRDMLICGAGLPGRRPRCRACAEAGARRGAGSAAGLAAQTICYPLDTVRHRMQANGIGGQPRVYASTWDCVAQMAAKEGVRGFFRGWGLNAFRALPGAAVQFSSYDTLKRLLGVAG